MRWCIVLGPPSLVSSGLPSRALCTRVRACACSGMAPRRRRPRQASLARPGTPTHFFGGGP